MAESKHILPFKQIDILHPLGNRAFSERYGSSPAKKRKVFLILIGSRPLLVRPRGCSADAGRENEAGSATVCYHGDMLISSDEKARGVQGL